MWHYIANCHVSAFFCYLRNYSFLVILMNHFPTTAWERRLVNNTHGNVTLMYTWSILSQTIITYLVYLFSIQALTKLTLVVGIIAIKL